MRTTAAVLTRNHPLADLNTGYADLHARQQSRRTRHVVAPVSGSA